MTTGRINQVTVSILLSSPWLSITSPLHWTCPVQTELIQWWATERKRKRVRKGVTDIIDKTNKFSVSLLSLADEAPLRKWMVQTPCITGPPWMLLNPLRFETVGPDSIWLTLSEWVKERERLLFQIGTKRKVPPHLNKTRAAYCLLMIAQTRCYLRLTELYTFSARLQIHNPSNSLGRSRELEKPRLKSTFLPTLPFPLDDQGRR